MSKITLIADLTPYGKLWEIVFIETCKYAEAVPGFDSLILSDQYLVIDLSVRTMCVFSKSISKTTRAERHPVSLARADYPAGAAGLGQEVDALCEKLTQPKSKLSASIFFLVLERPMVVPGFGLLSVTQQKSVVELCILTMQTAVQILNGSTKLGGSAGA